MRLENLYPNFGTATQEEQMAYIASYRLRRASDLESVQSTVKTTKKTKAATVSKIEISDEEKRLMKMLGIKPKDLAALRSATACEEESDNDSNGEIFKDDTFVEGEEDD